MNPLQTSRLVVNECTLDGDSCTFCDHREECPFDTRIRGCAYRGRKLTEEEAWERIRREAGEEWDDEEFYFIRDEMLKDFPAMEYEQVSGCAGLMILPAGCGGKP